MFKKCSLLFKNQTILLNHIKNSKNPDAINKREIIPNMRVTFDHFWIIERKMASLFFTDTLHYRPIWTDGYEKFYQKERKNDHKVK